MENGDGIDRERADEVLFEVERAQIDEAAQVWREVDDAVVAQIERPQRGEQRLLQQLTRDLTDTNSDQSLVCTSGT